MAKDGRVKTVALDEVEIKQALCDLADKIERYYGKTELAETKTRRG